MTARAPVLASALAALLALSASPVEAQRTPWQVGGGAGFELYSFAEEAELESVALLTLPFGARGELGGGFDVRADGAWARGSATLQGGRTVELSGPTDTEVRLGYGIADQAVRLELIGYLPTGSSTHDEEEATVAGIVAADVLPFRISHWGTGGAVALSASGARSFGAFGAGISASYRLSDEFDPIEGQDFRYRPGDELRLRVALNYDLDRSQRLSLAVGYRNYEADAANDENLFQTGDRLEALATWSFPTSLRSAAALYGGVIHREGGSFIQAAAAGVPPQDLVLLGGVLRAPFAGGFIVPRVDARLFRPEDGAGEGFVVGAGASLEIPAGPSLTVLPMLTGRIGSVEFEEGTGFVGFDAGLTLRFGPRGR